MVWVLRTGEGRLASYLELAFQGVLVGLAGYAIYRNPFRRRWLVFAAVVVVALVLLLPAIVLYGEATVAPSSSPFPRGTTTGSEVVPRVHRPPRSKVAWTCSVKAGRSTHCHDPS